MLKDKAKQEIREYIQDRLPDYKNSDTFGCDLHNELFNTVYYIIGTYEAEQWLGEETFDAIDEIQEYEKFNFGEVISDLSNPEKVVNMYVYILGKEILQESETLQNRWNEYLTNEDIDKICKELE